MQCFIEHDIVSKLTETGCWAMKTLAMHRMANSNMVRRRHEMT